MRQPIHNNLQRTRHPASFKVFRAAGRLGSPIENPRQVQA
jgi:hypothetical protein